MRRRTAFVGAAALLALAAAAVRTCSAPPDVPAPDPAGATPALSPAKSAASGERPRAPRARAGGTESASATASEGPATGTTAAAPPVPPARLTVTVRRADGKPAAGARVFVGFSDQMGGGLVGGDWERVPDPCAPLTADAEGRVTFEAEHFWCVWASASDGDTAGISDPRTALRPGQSGGTTVTLAASLRVRGAVTDLDGTRVPGAKVRLLVDDPLSSMASSVGPYAWAVDPLSCRDGAFEFPPVVPSSPPADESKAWSAPREMTVEASAEGFLSVRHPLTIEAAKEPVTVALVRTGVLRGRCVDAEGRAIAGVAISRAPTWEESFQTRPWAVTTGADGRFEFADFPEVGGRIELARDGYAPSAADVARFDPRAGSDLGELLLAGGLKANGRVVGADGVPVTGAGVWFGRQKGTTDAEGRFTVEHLPPGPWHVYVQDDAGQRRASLDVADLAEPVTVVVRNDRHVHLRIAFAFGAEPGDDPPYLRVLWRRETDPADARANERWERKRYDLWLQPESAGRWIVRVEMAGWQPAEVPVEVLAGRAVEAQVTLRK